MDIKELLKERLSLAHHFGAYFTNAERKLLDGKNSADIQSRRAG
jgi:hypothetical protein